MKILQWLGKSTELDMRLGSLLGSCSNTLGFISFKALSEKLIDAFELWCWEKTLESSLDSKEMQPVHPKGNQSWAFIGRTDNETETPILWPPDAKSWFNLGLVGLISFQSKGPWRPHLGTPTPQFRSIYSSVLSLFYGPTLTSIHNYWRNHSFD